MGDRETIAEEATAMISMTYEQAYNWGRYSARALLQLGRACDLDEQYSAMARQYGELAAGAWVAGFSSNSATTPAQPRDMGDMLLMLARRAEWEAANNPEVW